MGRRPLPIGLQSRQRRRQETLLRMGNAEHQQPQRAHPQKKLPGSSSLLAALHLDERGQGPLEASDL